MGTRAASAGPDDPWLDAELVRLRIHYVEMMSAWRAVRPSAGALGDSELTGEQQAVMWVAKRAEAAYDERRRALGLLG